MSLSIHPSSYGYGAEEGPKSVFNGQSLYSTDRHLLACELDTAPPQLCSLFSTFGHVDALISDLGGRRPTSNIPISICKYNDIGIEIHQYWYFLYQYNYITILEADWRVRRAWLCAPRSHSCLCVRACICAPHVSRYNDIFAPGATALAAGLRHVPRLRHLLLG
jgi:hypothetical protein